MSLRVGVCILPEARWAEARRRWQAAEQLGFDHAWTYDHLSWRTFHDDAWFAMVPTLTAAAEATETIRLGPLVASPNFREPVLFAKDLVALDDISGGRLILGIGAGGVGWDATALGQEAWSPVERADHFEEMVTLLDLLLRQPATTWRGRHYAADDARMIPGCVQQPRLPFAVAAIGPRGLRLAARHGQAWVTYGPKEGGRRTPEDGAAVIAEQVSRLEAACAEAGRDPGTIDRIVLAGAELDPGLSSEDHFDEVAARYEAAGATDLVVHWPRPEGIYAADQAVFERIFSR